MMNWSFLPKLLVAIWRREPLGHIHDLWDLWLGNCIVCGKPPYEYLLRIK